MAKPYGGVSSQTMRGLIESGAMEAKDFGLGPAPQATTPSIPLGNIGKDPTRQMGMDEYKKELGKQKSETDANYLKYKNRGKNLGKFLYKKKKGVYGDR